VARGEAKGDGESVLPGGGIMRRSRMFQAITAKGTRLKRGLEGE